MTDLYISVIQVGNQYLTKVGKESKLSQASKDSCFSSVRMTAHNSSIGDYIMTNKNLSSMLADNLANNLNKKGGKLNGIKDLNMK